jgi:O-antigen ligase
LKSKTLERLALKLEPWLVGGMVMYFLGVNTLPLINTAMKAGSYAILGLLISWQWKRFAYMATRDISLLLLIAMAPLSLFWSASPEFTSIEYKSVVRGSLFGIYLATRYSMKEQMQLWTWVLGIGAVLSLVFSIGLPSYGVQGGLWIGIYIYKNQAAGVQTLTALLVLLTALNRRKHRWIAWTVFSIAVVLLGLTQSKTAYSIFLISLGLLPITTVAKQKYKLQVVLFLILLVVGGSTIVLVLSNLEFIVVDTLGKNMEFNGRVPIWTLILDKVYERPWLGYGTAGFWTSEHALYVLNNSWAGTGDAGIGAGAVRFNAHNGYLDLLLQYGFVGVSLLLFNWLTVLFRLVALLNSKEGLEAFWMLQYIIVLFLFNLSENIGLLGLSSMWSLYVSIALSTALQQERVRKKRYILSETTEQSL